MGSKQKNRLRIAKDKTQSAINKTNKIIEDVGIHASSLYETLNNIQELFDKIKNVPTDKKLQYEELKQIRLDWKCQAEKIEKDYSEATVKKAGIGVVGVGAGTAVVTMGPTVAMGVATTFGVASTGTSISTLSGAAATNAALAWLGGGALAAEGGGVAAGNVLLTLAGPVGWAIAGVTLITSGIFILKNKSDQKHIENVFTYISDRDVKSYELAIVELKERITRITDEGTKLESAIEKIQKFGIDYDKMTDAQQYELGAYVNLMSSSTQLLVSPIKGIQPKYSNEDYKQYILGIEKSSQNTLDEHHEELVVYLANFLYKIELNDKEKKLLWKSMRKNKKMLKSMHISKKEFNISILDVVFEALQYKYGLIES